MLDPGSVDLRRLADALEDRDGEARWFLHLRTGELVARTQDADPDDDLAWFAVQEVPHLV